MVHHNTKVIGVWITPQTGAFHRAHPSDTPLSACDLGV